VGRGGSPFAGVIHVTFRAQHLGALEENR
jgi:hypothetical protein